jgi:prefoldin subunit 5
MVDAQVAFENLEAARSIIRNSITTLNIELQKLQEQVKYTQQQITQLHQFLSKTLKRIGDLQQWY